MCVPQIVHFACWWTNQLPSPMRRALHFALYLACSVVAAVSVVPQPLTPRSASQRPPPRPLAAPPSRTRARRPCGPSFCGTRRTSRARAGGCATCAVPTPASSTWSPRPPPPLTATPGGSLWHAVGQWKKNSPEKTECHWTWPCLLTYWLEALCDARPPLTC